MPLLLGHSSSHMVDDFGYDLAVREDILHRQILWLAFGDSFSFAFCWDFMDLSELA